MEYLEQAPRPSSQAFTNLNASSGTKWYQNGKFSNHHIMVYPKISSFIFIGEKRHYPVAL